MNRAPSKQLLLAGAAIAAFVAAMAAVIILSAAAPTARTGKQLGTPGANTATGKATGTSGPANVKAGRYQGGKLTFALPKDATAVKAAGVSAGIHDVRLRAARSDVRVGAQPATSTVGAGQVAYAYGGNAIVTKAPTVSPGAYVIEMRSKHHVSVVVVTVKNGTLITVTANARRADAPGARKVARGIARRARVSGPAGA